MSYHVQKLNPTTIRLVKSQQTLLQRRIVALKIALTLIEKARNQKEQDEQTQ